MRAPVLLVLAKAPVPGAAKTRLAATEGDHRAAGLASAALLDTLDLCEELVGTRRCVVALTGELDRAVGGAEIARRLGDWTVLEQRGETLGERIAHAHRDTHARAGAAGPVVQIGMDTPHVGARLLGEVVRAATTAPAVLGHAEDGGWWVLSSREPAVVDGLEQVPMSDAETGRRTWELVSSRWPDAAGVTGTFDIDDRADAARAASLTPGSRLARAWHAPAEVGS